MIEFPSEIWKRTTKYAIYWNVLKQFNVHGKNVEYCVWCNSNNAMNMDWMSLQSFCGRKEKRWAQTTTIMRKSSIGIIASSIEMNALHKYGYDEVRFSMKMLQIRAYWQRMVVIDALESKYRRHFFEFSTRSNGITYLRWCGYNWNIEYFLLVLNIQCKHECCWMNENGLTFVGTKEEWTCCNEKVANNINTNWLILYYIPDTSKEVFKLQ